MHHPDTASFLSDEDYLQVIAYILVQNGTLKESDPFGMGNMSSVILSSQPGTTAGDLAAMGMVKYNGSCAQTYCHDTFGQGGEDQFNAQKLSYFTDAQDMLNFITSLMHQQDTTLNLTQEDYVNILAYILVQNGTLKESDPFGMGNLKSVKLGG
jgi:hypothetical protein